MITSIAQYRQAVEAQRELEEAMLALRDRLGEGHIQLFSVMAQDYVESIAEIRLEIEAFLGIDEVLVHSAPLWLGLDGEGLSPRNVRSSILTGWLERLRKALTATVSGHRNDWRSVGRPSADVLSACDFRVLGFQPGSLRIGLELPGPDQRGLFEPAEDANEEAIRSLKELLTEAAVVGSLGIRGDMQQLIREAEDPRRRFLLRQVLRVIPGRLERVRSVELDGTLVETESPIRLPFSVRPMVSAALAGEPDVGETEEVEGQLREVDLDERHFIIRERPNGLQPQKMFFSLQLLEEVKQALDRRVRVEAVKGRGARARWSAVAVEILGDADQ